MQDGSVNILDLSVGLGVSHRSEVLLDVELSAPFLERVVRELSVVIRDESPRYANRQMMLFQRNLWIDLLLIVLRGSASTHLVK